jgi:hypothetical protein
MGKSAANPRAPHDIAQPPPTRTRVRKAPRSAIEETPPEHPQSVSLPAERLLTLLAEAREDAQRFDEASPAAIKTATKGPDRAAWMAALEATRGAWLRVYGRLPPTKAEQAVAVLVDNGDLVGV